MEEQNSTKINQEQNEEQEQEYEEEIISWQVPEHNTYKRTRTWYIIFSIVVGALLLYGFFSQNFLFVVIIILASLTMLLHNSEEAPIINFTLTDEGVIVGKRFYDYDEFEHFAIVYKPSQGIKNLYFEFKSNFRPRLSVPINNINPVRLREILSAYLDEDQERTDPPTSEEIARFLKI